MERISGVQFGVFRLVLGGALAVRFLMQGGGEGGGNELLHRAAGAVSEHGAFVVWPWQHFFWQGVCFVAALALALGVKRRIAAGVIFAVLGGGNAPFLVPETLFTLLSLLVCALVPSGEPLTLVQSRKQGESRKQGAVEWRSPQLLAPIAWGAFLLPIAVQGVVMFLSLKFEHIPVVHEAGQQAGQQSSLVFTTVKGEGWAWGKVTAFLLAVPLSVFCRGRAVVWGVFLLFALFAPEWGGAPLFLLLFEPVWCPPRVSSGTKIVFFDGECGFCHRGVRLLAQLDHHQVLTFSPLQGETAAGALPEHLRIQPGSVVYLRGEKTLTRTGALLAALDDVGGFARILSLTRVVPAVFRDALYTLVSNNRQRLSRWCGLAPTEGDRPRFLP